VGGGERIRGIWKNYFHEVRAFSESIAIFATVTDLWNDIRRGRAGKRKTRRGAYGVARVLVARTNAWETGVVAIE
jgi:hypothetical protein